MWTYLGQVVPAPNQIKIKAENRYGPHTAGKSEISGHMYPNYTMLLNSGTIKCFTFTELARSTSATQIRRIRVFYYLNAE